MDSYQANKEVKAQKIKAVSWSKTDGSAFLTLEDDTIVRGAAEWLQANRPWAGGYYVVYEDGQASFMTAAAFEASHTRI